MKPPAFGARGLSRKARIYACVLCATALSSASLHGMANAPNCRDDITSGMGYKVRAVRVQARWISQDLIKRLEEIVKVGGLYSPSVVGLAHVAVENELLSKENRSLEFATLGAASVLVIDSCVLDVSDDQHPKQVDIVIRPHYLRVDLYNVGSNILPIPRSIEPTFYESVPTVLRSWNPQAGILYDRAYGTSVTLRTSRTLLAGLMSNTNEVASPHFELSATGQKSITDTFYDAETSLALAQRELKGESRSGWSVATSYNGYLHPLGDGEFLRNAGEIKAQFQLKPQDGLLNTVFFGADLQGSSNRLRDKNGATISDDSEVALGARTLLDGRLAGGLARFGLWGDSGFRDGGSSYQRLAGFLGYGTELGSGHQTVGVELLLGGGKIWGDAPEFARFYGGNSTSNFLYESADSATLGSFPTGPLIRTFGQGTAGSRNSSGAIRGGTSFWNVSLNLAIPLPRFSRPLVPDIVLGRSTLAQKLKSVVISAKNYINQDMVDQGMPDNSETEAKADAIVNRDIKPTIDFLADHANIYAIKPLLLIDVAGIDAPDGQSDRARVGVGGGLQITVVTAKVELGYMQAVRRERGDPSGNFFLRLVFENLF